MLEESKISEKIYAIDKHLYAVVSGLSADANYLINLLREYAQVQFSSFRTTVSSLGLLFLLRRLLSTFATSSSSTPKLEERDLLVLLSSLLDTTRMASSSSTQPILLEITQDGRPLPSAATTSLLTPSSSRNTKRISLWRRDSALHSKHWLRPWRQPTLIPKSEYSHIK